MKHAAFLLTLLVLAPNAMAAISLREPNTELDSPEFGGAWAPSDGFYFDMVLVPYIGSTDFVVPAGYAAYRGYIYYGDWTDCNGDGRLGMPELGVVNYPAEWLPNLPADGQACNRGGIAWELRMASPAGGPGRIPYRALVWGDLSWPGLPPADLVTLRTVGGGSSTEPPAFPDDQPKRDADFHFRFVDDASAYDLMPEHPAHALRCVHERCAGWWSDEVALLPTDPADVMSLRTAAYADGPGATTDLRMMYGNEACETVFGAGAGVRHGWDCDSSHWPGDGIYPAKIVNRADFDRVPTMIHLAVEVDADVNGLGDDWTSRHFPVESYVTGLMDLDGDCLANFGEFAWGYVPVPILGNAKDFDRDGLADAEEVAFWNNPANDVASYYATTPECPVRAQAGTSPSTGVAPTDPDRLIDTDGDLVPNAWDADSDNDGLTDGAELTPDANWGFTSHPAHADTDGDTLSDFVERGPYGVQSDPSDPDSDDDGLEDGAEFELWTRLSIDPRADLDGDGRPNLLDADSDGDALGDAEEQAWRTRPDLPDTDGDTMPDGWEAKWALDPLRDDAQDDSLDGDGVPNLVEWRENASPQLADTDRDGLRDDVEWRDTGTRLDHHDTDRDGMPDGWEAAQRFQPLDPRDADEDADHDGFEAADGTHARWPNLAEYLYGRPPAWDEARDGAWNGGTDPHDSDSDGDGMTDGEEAYAGTPMSAQVGTPEDADNDGLTNGEEYRLGLVPWDPDSDDDGLCDGGRTSACTVDTIPGHGPGEVLDFHTNPYPPNQDTDLDGLSDGAEALDALRREDVDGDGLHAALDSDSDNDGLLDGEENRLGLDPFAADTDGDTRLDGAEVEDGTDPREDDSDQDDADDGIEHSRGLDPRDPDCDDDGLPDGAEIAQGTDPWREDTDFDGMPDGWEVEHQLAPTDATDAMSDADADGLDNLGEHDAHADPRLMDTDRDGAWDGIEVTFGTRPDVSEFTLPEDLDGDGLTGAEEYAFGTDPRWADSDADGLTDFDETKEALRVPFQFAASAPAAKTMARPPTAHQADTWRLASDPTDADTDDDGLADGHELDLWRTLGADAWRTDHSTHLMPPGHSNLRRSDSDGDGLDDGQEFLTLGTDPRLPDTDGDSYSDAQEIEAGSRPRDPTSTPADQPDRATDTDHDGLSDWNETHETGTDAARLDTDEDGIDDGHELNAWLTRRQTHRISDVAPLLRNPDVDGDGAPDGDEFAGGTLPRALYSASDPDNPDSDGDGIRDGAESGALGAIPLRALNGLPEAEPKAPAARLPNPLADLEAKPPVALHGGVRGAWGTWLPKTSVQTPVGSASPQPDAPAGCVDGMPRRDQRDTDGDGLTDGDEAPENAPPLSDPCRLDGDDDDVGDQREVRRNGRLDRDADGAPSALDPDSDDDGDPDGTEDRNRNGFPDVGEPSFLDKDTDDDGIMDTDEAAQLLNALNPDSDADGLPDGLEKGVHLPVYAAPGVLPWTNPDRDMTCGGTPIGKTFVPAPADMDIQALDPTEPDRDEDGLLDGLEDFDHDGHFGRTLDGYGEGDLLFGDLQELRPDVPDFDADGLGDQAELQFYRTVTYCQAFAKYLGNKDIMRYALGDPEPFVSHAINPRAPDTDGDGVLDAVDVDPRKATSLLKIVRLDYQQLEEADSNYDEEEGFFGDGDYNIELGISLSLSISGVKTVLPFGLIEDFPALQPHSVLDAPLAPDVSVGQALFATRFGPEIHLGMPQDAESYGIGPDATKAIVGVHATDRDVWYHDPLDISRSEDELDLTASVNLLSPNEVIFVTDEGEPRNDVDLAGAEAGRVALGLRMPFQGFFFCRALALEGNCG